MKCNNCGNKIDLLRERWLVAFDRGRALFFCAICRLLHEGSTITAPPPCSVEFDQPEDDNDPTA